MYNVGKKEEKKLTTAKTAKRRSEESGKNAGSLQAQIGHSAALARQYFLSSPQIQ